MFSHVQVRGMQSRNKTTMEFIVKGWSAMQEVDRVIDYSELNDKRLIPLLRVESVLDPYEDDDDEENQDDNVSLGADSTRKDDGPKFGNEVCLLFAAMKEAASSI